MTAGKIARELFWTNKEFSSVDIIPPLFSTLIYHTAMNNGPAGGRSSKT
jgi:hypothetical protein